MTILRRWTGWTAVVALPFLLLAFLLTHGTRDPLWMSFGFHFYVVSLTTFLTLGLAGLMAVAARQMRDARVFLMALAFLSISGILLIHALTTPHALVADVNPWVGFTSYFSVLVGAIALALSAVEWGERLSALIIRRQGAILASVVAALLVFGVVAILTAARPVSGAGMHSAVVTPPARVGGADAGYGAEAAPTSTTDTPPAVNVHPIFSTSVNWLAILYDQRIARTSAVITLLLLTLMIARYTFLYRAGRSPMMAGFLASGIFLAQSQVSLSIAPLWHASWWMSHALMLAAFVAALVGLQREYARSGSWGETVTGLLLRDTIAQLERGYGDVIVALIAAVEAKDPYTRGHTQRVAALALQIGRELRLTPERLRVLHQAALPHDIGKIGVPDAILNKPGGLTADEFAVIREHPIRGHEIIKGVRSLRGEIDGIRYHHERLDGSGYPDGLVGDAIPLDARIIAVADVYDALTSPRSYRAAWSSARALATIDADAGPRLDARCVAALHRLLQEEAPATSRPPAAGVRRDMALSMADALVVRDELRSSGD